MKQLTRIVTGCIIFLFTIINSGYPWGSTAHRLINLKAVMHLPVEMNTLKADSLFYRSHASDADYRKDYSDTSFFAEAQRHYIDIDIYPNFYNLPHTLDSMFLIAEPLYVWQNGTLPWATKMVLDSLTAQLARNDLNTAKQTMSDLGHYVGDAHQPLHCTWNYDPDGLHRRYETKMIDTYQYSIVINSDSIHYLSSPLDFIFDCIYHSNSLVDSLITADNYAKSTSGWNGTGDAPADYFAALWQKTENFTKDQIQRATVALASLWYTAWYNAQVINTVDETLNSDIHSFTLNQNYPNPFNPTTTIDFKLQASSFTSLKIFDIFGREITILVNDVKPPGEYRITWNALNIPSGAYFYKLQVGELTINRKMILAK